MFRKSEAKTTGEHPCGRVIPKNHTPAPALPRKFAAHSQNTNPEEHLQRAASVLIFNQKLIKSKNTCRFCQKKLIKSKNS